MESEKKRYRIEYGIESWNSEKSEREAIRGFGELYPWELAEELEACRARGLSEELFLAARKIDPDVSCRECAHCKAQGASKPNYRSIRLVFSRKSYPYSEADRRKGKPDPNGPTPMCPECAEEDAAYWDEMWSNYYEG